MATIKEVFDKQDKQDKQNIQRFQKLEGSEDYHQVWGSTFTDLYESDIKHLRDGKILYIFDGEYDHYFRIKTSMDEALE